MGITRIPTDPAHYTFKAGIGTEHVGRCIDHIMSNSSKCTAEVSQNGRFLSDHMPLVATITVTGIEKNQGTRLKQMVIPTIKAGDTGARKRLEKMMAKTLGGDLEDWTLSQLVNWTSNAAKEVAKTRNKKDNPDGWSPLTRVMRLKVKVLGALYKRLEAKLCPDVCLKLYKEVKNDIRHVELSEEEEEWLIDNRIEKDLPNWLDWKRTASLSTLSEEIKILNRQTSNKMRKEQRLKFENWTRTIQEAADKGNIGKILKR